MKRAILLVLLINGCSILTPSRDELVADCILEQVYAEVPLFGPVVNPDVDDAYDYCTRRYPK